MARTYTNPAASTLQQWLLSLLLLSCLGSTGCVMNLPESAEIPVSSVLYDAPRELNKTTLPTYRVAPPDVLSIDAVQNIPESNYLLHVGDSIALSVSRTFPDEPIAGIYPIETGGVIQLGFDYGRVEVIGRTVEEARLLIREHLRSVANLRDPKVTIGLRDIAGLQQISGEHLVGPDGRVTLGKYGSVSLVGMTLEEAQVVLADYLSEYFSAPEVSVSVFSYNSRHYYVVTEGAGLGDDIVRLPYTGNETVLDAISHINGLSPVSSTKLWIARPGRNEIGGNQILPVDWVGITQRGEVETNYQLLPGDRLYISEDRFAALDGAVARITSPLERIFGFSLLGVSTTSRFSGKVLNNQPATAVFTNN